MAPTPINLAASTDTTVLVNAIKRANLENRDLVLLPGTHLTKPAHNETIPIDANGLRIKGTLNLVTFSAIKRPDRSINLEASDSNNGLFFVPAPPTDKELAAIKSSDWKPYTNPVNTDVHYDYIIIVRGSITIEGIELDCNMGMQGLPATMPSEQIEHSGMLVFAGKKYQHPTLENKVIFVAFKNVTLNNIRTVRGGYADDIWINRGYFRPNIEKVQISNITSDLNNTTNPQPRINPKRSTIQVSGLTQNVEITNAKIYKLEAEDTMAVHWRDFPGDELTKLTYYSRWKLKKISCETLDIAAKGKSISLDATNLEVSKQANFYQLGGEIKDSVIHLPSQFISLNRLNDLLFNKVTWIFTASETGEVGGLAIKAQYGESFSAVFDRNIFKVVGAFTSGQFIYSEYSRDEPGNTVKLTFTQCTYQPGSPGSAAHIANVKERGTWKFDKADFNGADISNILQILPAAVVSQTATLVKIKIA